MDNSLVSFPQPRESSETLPAVAGASGNSALAAYDSSYAPAYSAPPVRRDPMAKIRRYWAAIKRFWWLILIFVILGSGAGLFATRYVSPMYEASGRLWIADANQSSPLRTSELLPTASWVELFRSFAVVDPVVDSLNLWYAAKLLTDAPALKGLRPARPGGEGVVPGQYTLTFGTNGNYSITEAELGEVERGTIGDSVTGDVGRNLGIAWRPSLSVLQSTGKNAIAFNVWQPRAVAVNLTQQVALTMGERSNLLSVSLAGGDKTRTANLLNEWMRQFVDKAVQLRRRNTSDVAGILSAQRGSAEAQLRAAEEALRQFRTNSITQPGDGGGTSPGSSADAVAADFFRTQGELETLRRDRESLEQVAEQGRNGSMSPDAVLVIGSVAQTPTLSTAVKELIDKETQLRTLRQSYTDEYKPVKDLEATVQTMRTVTIPSLATDAANLLRRRENQLASKLRRDTVQLRGIPQRSLEEARLRRDLVAAEEFFKNVDNRYESARLGSVSTVPDVSILDPAQASITASSNMKIVLLGAGVFGSLMFGVVLALFLDAVDHRFRYPEQISDELNLEVIGAIPLVPKPSAVANNPELMLQSVEAFRGLRMQMHHAFETPPVMMTITSPGAGDGKSMIASNLALSFAEAGYRTLLIDGDIRRGKLHAVFGVQRRPGLVDYLAGDVELSEVMREVAVNGRLSVIPSGTRRHRGPELLTSARLPALFNTVRTRYDVVIVDSAPLGAGIDGYALGVATGNLALVMRTGVTDRRMAKAKLKLLERFPVRMMGVIVNDVPASELYQEYSYLYGYGPDIDTDAGTEKVPMLRQTDVSHK